MGFIDDARSKYATLDTSGRLIAIIAVTSIVGWVLERLYEPLYRQFVLPPIE